LRLTASPQRGDGHIPVDAVLRKPKCADESKRHPVEVLTMEASPRFVTFRWPPVYHAIIRPSVPVIDGIALDDPA